MEKNIVSELRKNYGITVEKVEPLEEYSFIFKIKTDVDDYYLKFIRRADILDEFYSLQKRNVDILIPIQNKKGRYISFYGEKSYILLPKCEKIVVSPESDWWARVLSRIHLYNKLSNGTCIIDNFYEHTLVLWKKAKVFLDTDLISIIESIIPIKCSMNCQLVLVHGDPLRSNVMARNGKYVLIDFDSIGVANIEFDIQRNLCDYAIQCKDYFAFEAYKNNLLVQYQYITNESVDLVALQYYYALDLIRTFSWLVVICESKNRDDIKRQRCEKDKYKDSILSGLQSNIIRRMY